MAQPFDSSVAFDTSRIPVSDEAAGRDAQVIPLRVGQTTEVVSENAAALIAKLMDIEDLNGVDPSRVDALLEFAFTTYVELQPEPARPLDRVDHIRAFAQGKSRVELQEQFPEMTLSEMAAGRLLFAERLAAAGQTPRLIEMLLAPAAVSQVIEIGKEADATEAFVVFEEPRSDTLKTAVTEVSVLPHVIDKKTAEAPIVITDDVSTAKPAPDTTLPQTSEPKRVLEPIGPERLIDEDSESISLLLTRLLKGRALEDGALDVLTDHLVGRDVSDLALLRNSASILRETISTKHTAFIDLRVGKNPVDGTGLYILRTVLGYNGEIPRNLQDILEMYQVFAGEYTTIEDLREVIEATLYQVESLDRYLSRRRRTGLYR